MSQTLLALLAQVAAATAGEYHVVGALGETVRGSAFLARELTGGHLVVLFVPADADELAVLAALGDGVPANAGRCTACGHAPPVWAVACPSCQRPFVLTAVGAHRFTPEEVHDAVAHAYDVEGEVAHQAGGSLFFVRDRADHRLVALAGQDDESGQVLEAVWDAASADPPPALAPPLGAVGLDGSVSDPVPPARRRWGPLVAGGALLLVAGGAWALWRDDPAPPPVPDARAASTAVVPSPDAEPAAVAAGPDAGATGAAPPDTLAGALTGGAARPRGGVAAAEPRRNPPPPNADERRDAGRGATAWLQVGGSLPAGWSWVINGRRGPDAVTARLRPNRPVSAQLEAPGYCPVSLQLPPQAPGAVYQWYPQLRGKPMVGDCR